MVEFYAWSRQCFTLHTVYCRTALISNIQIHRHLGIQTLMQQCWLQTPLIELFDWRIQIFKWTIASFFLPLNIFKKKQSKTSICITCIHVFMYLPMYKLIFVLSVPCITGWSILKYWFMIAKRRKVSINWKKEDVSVL